ncbi:uncharacterized protein LOC122617062 [Drosophila teissieri]|uniref:uncharacterized protein LOC122617062 n=1 Tax=Drosophila teissieri TaxID=7243 RepID=UPI001CBA38B5|nr:uncharacterized protein LOC122617062 [Drosophila teissieri]XP_043648669.1 uncharacterized protein LOC122617062 [Drosophila teissieri]
MSNLARRALHGNEPGNLSQSEDDVDQNNTCNRQPAHNFEEGTSSADELEESITHENPCTPKPTNQSRKRSISTPRPSSRPKQDHSINEPQNGIGIKLALAGVLFGLMVVYGYGTSIIEEKQCAFKDLRTKYPLQQEKVWKALQKGLEGLINKKDKHPSVFLFLHQDPKLQKLIDQIAIEASMCFGGPRKLIYMKKEDMKDYSLAIEQFKAKMNDGKVFLIVNLNDISPNGARALHTICDTYSPLVNDAVIFLSLQTFNTTAVNNSVKLATDTLYDLWDKELRDHELDPLITRVTDQVLHLSSQS